MKEQANEPYEVVVKGRDLVIGYACPKCRIFHGATIYVCKWEEAVVASREAAERCCNRKCEDCAAIIHEKYHSFCTECMKKRDAAREQAAFDKAQKIPESEYTGFLYWRGEYFEDDDALQDHCEQNDLEWPEWVWACSKVEFSINAESIVEQALEEHHEDAHERIKSEDELQDFLDAWCAKQGISSWEEDRTTVVILRPR